MLALNGLFIMSILVKSFSFHFQSQKFRTTQRSVQSSTLNASRSLYFLNLWNVKYVKFMCVHAVDQFQSTKTLQLCTQWPSGQQLTPWRTDQAVCEPTGNVLESWDWEFVQVWEESARTGVLGPAAEDILWICHAMLSLIFTCTTRRESRVQREVTKKELRSRFPLNRP